MRVFFKFVAVVSLLVALDASLLAAVQCEWVPGSEKQTVATATARAVAEQGGCSVVQYSAPVAVAASYQVENYVQPSDVGAPLSSLVLSLHAPQWQSARPDELRRATSSPVSKQSLNCTFLI